MIVLLIAPLLILLAVLAVRWYMADARRQKALRGSLTVLSVASRARCLAECPPEFHARLRAAMNLSEETL